MTFYELRLKVYEISLIIISLLLLCALQLDCLTIPFVTKAHFFLLLSILVLNYIRTKTLNLYQTWIVGFIFIILSEMLILIDVKHFYIYQYVDTFTYLFLANDAILIGYYVKKWNYDSAESEYKLSPQRVRFFYVFITILYLYYLYYKIPAVLANISMGRQLENVLGSNSLGNVFRNCIELALPVIIGYHFKYVLNKNIISCLIWVVPLFMLVLLGGTRFIFLFAVVPFLVVTKLIDTQSRGIKQNIVLLLVAIPTVFLSAFVKINRNISISDLNKTSDRKEVVYNQNLYTQIAEEMSPEGVVEMTKLSEDYFKTHNHSYGKEISFILYFWVPRSFWPSKPKPIDHWLIRKYENVSDAHSTASGFTGELKADFGWFSLFFVFLLGMLLRRADCFVSFTLGHYSYIPSIILAALLFSYVFFFVRSPITSSISFIYQLILYKLYLYLFTKKNE